MTLKTKNLLLGLALACVPLPTVIHATILTAPSFSIDVLYFYLMLIGIPAAFLTIGYQHVQKTCIFDRADFLKSSVVVGICIGMLVILPLAYPMIYFRAENISAYYPASQLVGILCTLTAWSLLSATIFWGAAIKPMSKENEVRA